MKVAIIGSGIAGMTAAHYLHPHCDITLYEKSHRLGGHTATVDVSIKGHEYAIDTGFIVYNERTYPNFIRLMQALRVPVKPTAMGFSVSAAEQDLEYSGSGLNALFAQRRNLFSISHWRMIVDILRFNRQAPKHLIEGVVAEDTTLGDYLEQYGYSNAFKNHYLVPMGAAIWSAGTDAMLQFPMRFFIRFFDNHGLLQIRNRPRWYVIEGGSRNYIAPLTAGYRKNIHLASCIKNVRRTERGVDIVHENGETDHHDQVIFACHSDEAQALLGDDASEHENDILSAMPYQNNEVVLHTDETLLPKRKSTWSSWNYQLRSYRQNIPTLTYNMNMLQGIKAPVTFCVTLNNTQAIDQNRILASFNYAHPVFSLSSVAAQQRWSQINGVNRSWFCGAYWRNGFHEDGVVSALHVVNGILKIIKKPPILVLSGHD